MFRNPKSPSDCKYCLGLKVDATRLSLGIVGTYDLEEDDLENNDLGKDDLEDNDLENYDDDLENDDLENQF